MFKNEQLRIISFTILSQIGKEIKRKLIFYLKIIIFVIIGVKSKKFTNNISNFVAFSKKYVIL